MTALKLNYGDGIDNMLQKRNIEFLFPLGFLWGM